jgi:CDP-diacylglycerol--glycerol-3-phosphate 3-phosphatidyltransferase
MKNLPNIVTGLRLALTLVVFLALTSLAMPWLAAWSYDSGLTPRVVARFLYFVAFLGFVVAALTDFVDGWLARKLNAVSTLGAILDPIADKVLVAGMVIALALVSSWTAAVAGGLMLFREFAVSALRETLAPRGIKLPVTLLAKWKTTLQLFALGFHLFLFGWSLCWNLPEDGKLADNAQMASMALLWLAAAVTIWTGVEYALSARKALLAQDARAA